MQGDRSFGQLAVVDVERLHAVQHHADVGAFGGDVVRVPLPAYLDTVRGLAVVGNAAGAGAAIDSGIIDVHFVTIDGGDFRGVGATNEYAAIGFGVHPEFSDDAKVTVGFLSDQMADTDIGHRKAILYTEVRVAVKVPLVQARAVEQRDPAGFIHALLRGAAEQTQYRN